MLYSPGPPSKSCILNVKVLREAAKNKSSYFSGPAAKTSSLVATFLEGNFFGISSELKKVLFY